ncbi:MAG: NTP transferase domain-containing protein [Clostridia bacterium]|nr:NTP transferase domain-containing protein [Clostridia bacterium]
MEKMTRPPVSIGAECVKNLWRRSGKRHLFITGSKQRGKSTLFSAMFGQNAGLFSRFDRDAGLVELKNAQTGRASVIGRLENGKMTPVPGGFDHGTDALNSWSEGTFFIDEIGFLESSDPKYCAALKSLLDRVPVAAVLRKQPSPLFDREDALVVDLDEWYARFEALKLCCVVMASGRSERFSGNKLLAEFNGAPLVSSLFSAIPRELFETVVAVTRYEAVAELAKSAGLSALVHDEPALADTIRLGVEFCPGADGYMLCVGDQPFLSRDTFVALAADFALQPECILRPVCGDTPGNPVIFPACFRDELRSLSGEIGGRAVIRAHPEALVLHPIADPREFFDVDTRENYARLTEAR